MFLLYSTFLVGNIRGRLKYFEQCKSFVVYIVTKVYNLISVNSYQICDKTKQLNVTYKMVQNN